MPDVHTLRVFAAVADKMSLTRAAEALGLTQSAVSHQIAKLEAEMNAKVFDRQGRTIALTPCGRELRHYSREIISRVDALGEIVRRVTDADRGTLRIGATATACQHLLPDPIREMRECFPTCALHVVPGDSPLVAQWVTTGQVDLGIVVGGAHTGKLPLRPLFRDQLGLVYHPLHEFAKAAKFTADDLVGQHWVMYNRASATFAQIERHLTRMRVVIRNPIELGSIEAIKELVKVGLGVSVLAKWVVRSELASGSLLWRPLPGPALRREWSALVQPHRDLRLPEESLIEFCRAAGQALVAEGA